MQNSSDLKAKRPIHHLKQDIERLRAICNQIIHAPDDSPDTAAFVHDIKRVKVDECGPNNTKGGSSSERESVGELSKDQGRPKDNTKDTVNDENAVDESENRSGKKKKASSTARSGHVTFKEPESEDAQTGRALEVPEKRRTSVSAKSGGLKSEAVDGNKSERVVEPTPPSTVSETPSDRLPTPVPDTTTSIDSKDTEPAKVSSEEDQRELSVLRKSTKKLATLFKEVVFKPRSARPTKSSFDNEIEYLKALEKWYKFEIAFDKNKNLT